MAPLGIPSMTNRRFPTPEEKSQHPEIWGVPIHRSAYSQQMQAFIVSVQFLKPRRFWRPKPCVKSWLVLESTEQRALLALDLDRSILPGLRSVGCEIVSTVVEPADVNHNHRIIIEL